MITTLDVDRVRGRRRKSEAKAAATAPARFRRITKRTKVTAPCVLAKEDSWKPGAWKAMVAVNEQVLRDWIDSYTHFLPIQFPEGGAAMRDPKQDPRPGDVLRFNDEWKRIVTGRFGRNVEFFATHNGTHQGTFEVSIHCWRDSSDIAEVVHGAE